MNTNNQPLVVAKGASTLARARFGPGMLLQHDDLEQLTAYTRELNRLMFRSLFGCGVICGLVVSAKADCGKVTVTVDSGLALDCQGDPIHVPQPQKLVLDEGCDPNLKGPLWVVLCGTEKCCAPRAAMCESDEDESPPVCTRERDWFEIRIVRAPPRCTCGCPEPGPKSTTQNLPGNECRCVNPEHTCYAAHYAGKCGCDCEDCADGDCDCVLLARLDQDKDKDPAGQPVWTLDHRVRRFVRPVLMRDPQVWSEEQARKKDKDKKGEDEKEEESGATDGHKEEPPGALAEAGQAPAAAPPATAPGRPDTEILKRTRRRDHG